MSKRSNVSCGTCDDDERAERRLLGIVVAVALGVAAFSVASLASASTVVAGTTSGAAVTATAGAISIRWQVPAKKVDKAEGAIKQAQVVATP